MRDADGRLVRCFSSVFPGVPAQQIRTANVQSLSGWDSLTAVTLATVLQQEFGVEIDFAAFPESISYSAVRDYIQRRSGAA